MEGSSDLNSNMVEKNVIKETVAFDKIINKSDIVSDDADVHCENSGEEIVESEKTPENNENSEIFMAQAINKDCNDIVENSPDAVSIYEVQFEEACETMQNMPQEYGGTMLSLPQEYHESSSDYEPTPLVSMAMPQTNIESVGMENLQNESNYSQSKGKQEVENDSVVLEKNSEKEIEILVTCSEEANTDNNDNSTMEVKNKVGFSFSFIINYSSKFA